MLFQVFLLVLLGVTIQAAPVEDKQVQPVFPYHKLMIPDWLYKYSTITKPFTISAEYLQIPAGNEYERLIQVELVPPNVLTSTDGLVVTLTVAMDTVLADSSDHDPIFGLSDGTSFVGFIVPDKEYYDRNSPCYRHEGNIINEVLQVTGNGPRGLKVNSRHYSSEITIQIKPNDGWGSCHTEHDEGRVNVARFQQRLDVTKGLYLEMYRHGPAETYNVKYIMTNAYLD